MGKGPAGRLVVVGTGIRTTGQLTVEAIAWMKGADKLFHIVADPVALDVVELLRSDKAIDLRVHYAEGKPRLDSYKSMADAIVSEVVAGKIVCVALYGHPGVFAMVPGLAIRALRERGISAEMLPGISAEDCLFADLLVDPGEGCAQYEATNFIQHDHSADPSIHLLLWQIGMLGDWTHKAERKGPNADGNMQVLVDKLSHWYGRNHVVTIYQASVHLGVAPRADQVALRDLPRATVGSGCTLYVPPSIPFRRDHVFAGRLSRSVGGSN